MGVVSGRAAISLASDSGDAYADVCWNEGGTSRRDGNAAARSCALDDADEVGRHRELLGAVYLLLRDASCSRVGIGTFTVGIIDALEQGVMAERVWY